MSINFREKFRTIKDFIETNYPKYLEEFNIGPPKITTAHLDFDAFKNNFMLFIDFNTVNLNSDTWEDDCENTAQITCDIFLVFRNDTIENLHEKLTDASSALYNLLDNERTDMAANINVQEVNFFKYAEGNKNLAASKFPVEFDMKY